jgi:hypothetical protein
MSVDTLTPTPLPAAKARRKASIRSVERPSSSPITTEGSAPV